ncbi:MAG: hypothetical protein J6Z49_00675 [Kiritimatiellae bacterium]|nr:hypothetical protein [Kiritimatiellia bacterium]
MFRVRLTICIMGAFLAQVATFTAIAAENAEGRVWTSTHPDSEWQEVASQWETKRAEMTTPMEKLMIPLQYFDSGRVKARLFADKAQLIGLDDKGCIFAEGVRVEMLTEDGMQDGLLRADDCLFIRKGKKGFCKGKVSVVRGGDRISGEGMYFLLDEKYIKILSRCEIRTKRFQGTFGRLK